MNSTILAILLTSISVFILHLFFYSTITKKLKPVYHFILVLITACMIYFLFRGRAAIIGACANIVYLFYLKKVSVSSYFLLKCIASLTLIAFLAFLFLKKDSSNGRLLIYKVTFTQLKPQDYILGLGIGKFKARYNKLQAAYFEHKDLTSKEALLAGNGYYLFNDWLQVALEIGAIGISLIFSFVFLI